ncbi:MAG: nucleotidyl transferase AbiEii/AbiGii toxin family protein [Candidatus Taylorbacteria bacterium]|nr:nucleotidyl transferase AbiEii/AbiGii toxin family protein [Candidatus Taylorbacteria bacterium]
MDSLIAENLNFHWEVLPKPTKKALEFLSTEIWLGGLGWYLAGGTALALQTGHRSSVDLDFFTKEATFESTEVTGHFKENKDWKIQTDRPSTIYGVLYQAKVSFIAYPFFIPQKEFVRYGTVNILQPLDIAVMKIIAISQRGRKRDFFDLYWCAHHLEPLEKTMGRLAAQYPSIAHDYHHILKSLVYFEDAESDPPLMLHFKISWKEVKKFFNEEINKIAFKFI